MIAHQHKLRLQKVAFVQFVQLLQLNHCRGCFDDRLQLAGSMLGCFSLGCLISEWAKVFLREIIRVLTTSWWRPLK